MDAFVQKCQYYYTLSDQSVHVVTVRSNVPLLTEQLCARPNLPINMQAAYSLFQFFVHYIRVLELSYKILWFVQLNFLEFSQVFQWSCLFKRVRLCQNLQLDNNSRPICCFGINEMKEERKKL